jgi:hypothetical protein
MPAVEVAVPVGILSSAPLVAVKTLPVEKRTLLDSHLPEGVEQWFSLNAMGELLLHDKARQRIVHHAGTDVLRI